MDTSNGQPFVILAPADLLPATVSPSPYHTPYGSVPVFRSEGLTWFAPAPPHARIYAAKDLGFERVVEVLMLEAVNCLAALGDIIIPNDLVDLTCHRCPTFFIGKGYGFLAQNPPYCPQTRTTLLTVARRVAAALPVATQPRVFARGTCGMVERTDLPRNGERGTVQRQLAAWGVDVAGTEGVPTSFLARELELCYAPLGYIAATEAHAFKGRSSASTAETEGTAAQPSAPPPGRLLHTMLQQAAAELHPHLRLCTCGTTMQATRERGAVGDDWHTWVAPLPRSERYQGGWYE